MYYNDNGGLKGYIKYVGKHYLNIFIKILKIPYHTYMCIRYPFLYPRNRMDGKHHNYFLSSYRSKLWDKSTLSISITGKIITEPIYENNRILRKDFNAKLLPDKKSIIIWNHKEIKTFNVRNVIWNAFEVVNIFYSESITGKPIITIGVKKDSKDKNNYGFSYHCVNLITNYFLIKCYYLIKWIDEKILDNIFILPTYNEWEAMPYGWNKAFGKQFLKDLKKQLKKDKMLYSWRITTIKEKWGEFNLYCNKGTKELYSLIHKYENLSWNYCMKCGKPSTVKSIGWVLPYCKECAEKDNVHYEDINNNETF